MILDTLSGDPAYNFISSTLTSCFSAAIMKRVYSMIVENSRPNINVAVESETRMLMSKFMVFFLYMANKTGNGSLYTSGIIGIASNHAYVFMN